MNSVKFSERLIEEMKIAANESPLKSKLAAVILKNKIPIGHIRCNTERNLCQHQICSSQHAEQRVLTEYFNVNYSCGKWHNSNNSSPKGKGLPKGKGSPKGEEFYQV